jgi:hypothetical protein
MELNTSGKRTIFLRNLSGLTRKEFEIKYNIPIITLRSWESSAHIKEKAAQRFLSAIQQEGIECDLNWIVFGSGPRPSINNFLSKKINDVFSLGDCFDEEITEEIALLQKKYKNKFTSILINNDDNYPFLVIGDYIGGILVDSLSDLDKNLYIIECDNNITLIRQIIPTQTKDKYHLKAYNQDIEFPILYNQKIKKSWRIIWIRKRL